MNSSVQILPGVKKIYWVDCKYLPTRIDLKAISKIPVPLLIDLNPITFFGEVTCRRDTVKENGGWHETATLGFNSHEELPFSGHIGFVVIDANNQAYIIGGYEQPYPEVAIKKITGKPGGDIAGYSYEIKHNALRTLVDCLI